MSWFQGLSRPLRLAGFALIGVALVAAVIGGVTTLTGGNSTDTAAPPPSSAPPGDPGSAQNPPPPAPSAPPSDTPVTSEPPPPSSATPPPSSAAVPPPGQGEPNSAKWVPVRIYNNSTQKGLAGRAGDEMRGQGWNVAETSNYSAGIIPTTTAYFRPGDADEEAAARALGADFGMRVEPRFEGIAGSSPGVIVIVTNDYKGEAHSK